LAKKIIQSSKTKSKTIATIVGSKPWRNMEKRWVSKYIICTRNFKKWQMNKPRRINILSCFWIMKWLRILKSFMTNKASEREKSNNSVPHGEDHTVINLRSGEGISSDCSRGTRLSTRPSLWLCLLFFLILRMWMRNSQLSRMVKRAGYFIYIYGN